MTKANEDTLDPITNDDSLAESPREALDPVPAEEKPKRKPRPRMKKR